MRPQPIGAGRASLWATSTVSPKLSPDFHQAHDKQCSWTRANVHDRLTGDACQMTSESVQEPSFEKAAWRNMSPHYHGLAGRITRQAVSPLLDRAKVRRGDVLLDVATGPGYVAAAARELGARVLGLDFSEEMIAQARRTFPTLAVDLGDAENLPYEHGSFDIVTCAFGMLHFPWPGRATAEVWRVLRPRGRFLFTVWCESRRSRLFAAIAEVVQRFSDPSVARLPTGPGAFMLSDPMVSVAVMEAAGFSDVRVEEVPCYFDLTTREEMREFLHKCAPRALPIYEAQSAEVRARIDSALEDEGSRVLAEGGHVECPVLMVSGVRRGAPCQSF